MPKQEVFKTILPKNELVARHVAFYYFHKIDSSDFKRTFTYYPNYHIALNIFKGSEINWDEKSRFTTPSNSNCLKSIVTFTTAHSRDVIMRGKIDKIGIIFKPLGLNHFISSSLSSFIPETINFFSDFNLQEEKLLRQIYAEEDTHIKRDDLDNLLALRYKDFEDDIVICGVQLLLEKRGEMGVQELALELGINRKTLLRKFKKHVGCSVKNFCQLIKFRNTLITYKNRKGNIPLTELAYENQYYDQSSFIKHVTSVTGINPRRLFDELNDLEDEKTIWTLKE